MFVEHNSTKVTLSAFFTVLNCCDGRVFVQMNLKPLRVALNGQ